VQAAGHRGERGIELFFLAFVEVISKLILQLKFIEKFRQVVTAFCFVPCFEWTSVTRDNSQPFS
jgi:hypothetical protein